MQSWSFDEGDELVAGRTIVSLLGGGLRYEAYLVWDEHLRTLVVCKVLRPDRVDDAEALRGLRAESEALRRLGHPMLLRSFGAVLDGPAPHLVLEFLEGPRLASLIRRYGVIVEQLLPLALNLCSVLHYLAREEVVHLDVKPSNVIMDATPRLIDLSIARTFEGLADLRSPPGTEAYMAPEQCDPARFAAIGPPADVWGLGATLHAALGRRKPFAPDGEAFPQLRHGPRALPERTPAPLAAAVSACLAPLPEDRPTATQLADELEPLVGELPRPKMGRFRPHPST